MIVAVVMRNLMPVLKSSGKTVWIYSNEKKLLWSGPSKCIPDDLKNSIVVGFSADHNNVKIITDSSN